MITEPTPTHGDYHPRPVSTASEIATALLMAAAAYLILLAWINWLDWKGL
jgi:hypothetical protein